MNIRLFANKHASNLIVGVAGYAAGFGSNYFLWKSGYWKQANGEHMPPGAGDQKIERAKSGGSISQEHTTDGSARQIIGDVESSGDISQSIEKRRL